MLLISHRGNLEGSIPTLENSPEYIQTALDKGYDVEIDVWYKDSQLWLGHDEPSYQIDIKFLYNSHLWVHAKNVDALSHLIVRDINVFWHQEDHYTLTSKGFIWAYPNYDVPAGSKAIAVMPEWHNTDVKNFYGVCSDYIKQYD